MPPFVLRWPDSAASWRSVERWLLPGECLLCRDRTEPGPADPLICAPCRSRWSVLPQPQCSRCGQPEAPGIPCRLCNGWPEGLAGVQSAVWLDPGARRTVHLLKYAGWWRVAEAMAGTMHRLLTLSPGVTLVPIPLGATRHRTRGYNQSAVLARALGRLMGLPVVETVLGRGRETATQTALTPEERRANLAGAFRATAASPEHPILVDDVFTTGATLAEAAQALLVAGASRIGGVTFARAARPLTDAAAAPLAGRHT